MSQTSQLLSLITAIGADVKALQLSGGGSTDPEVVRDTIATALIPDTAKPGLTVTVDDPGDVIKIGLDPRVGINPLKQKIKSLIPKAGGNGFDSNGFIGGSVSGTLTAASKALTNRQTKTSRVESLVTVAATTAIAGYRLASAEFVRGNAAGVGGFYYCNEFGPATGCATATNRMFVGLRALTTARTDTEPSADVNVLGVGWDAADANIQMLCNDGASTCTKTDTGIAVPTVDRTSWYRLEMWCDPNDTTVYYLLTDMTSGVTFSGNFGTTNIPANNAYLCPHWTMSVGGTSSVIGIAIGMLYSVIGE